MAYRGERPQLLKTAALDILMDDMSASLGGVSAPKHKANDVSWYNSDTAIKHRKDKEDELLRRDGVPMTDLQKELLEIERRKEEQGRLEREHEEQLREIEKLKKSLMRGGRPPIVSE